MKSFEICEYVKEQYGIEYTVSGMTSWLKNNGFSFIKPHGVPSKADLEKQKQFVEEYEKLKKEAPKIHLILDNSGYNTSGDTKKYAEERGIILHFLPTYSPNLNPIERLWKVLNEYERNNKFFLNAKEFRDAIENFFHVTWISIAEQMKLRINDKFHLIQNN